MICTGANSVCCLSPLHALPATQSTRHRMRHLKVCFICWHRVQLCELDYPDPAPLPQKDTPMESSPFRRQRCNSLLWKGMKVKFWPGLYRIALIYNRVASLSQRVSRHESGRLAIQLPSPLRKVFSPFLPSWNLQEMRCRRDYIVHARQISETPQALENKNPWPFMIATVVFQQNTLHTIKLLNTWQKNAFARFWQKKKKKKSAIMKAA